MTNLPTLINPELLALAGQAANRVAAANVFEDYRQRTAANTLKRQAADLRLFERYLHEAGVLVCNLATDPACWQGMTWGIVAAFVQWELDKGYAIGSVNVRLATVKRYAELAHKAGVIRAEEYRLIKTVQGYGYKHAKQVDEKRNVTRIVRPGAKKAEAVKLSKEQADALKQQPNTPQGRRDALLMCLLLDHGLRCGEMAALKVSDFNLKVDKFIFDRPKVAKVQTHQMTADMLRAAAAYIALDCPAMGSLLQGSRKNGQLTGGMSERAINDRVGYLGKQIGIDGLSPHDCRHYWATRAATMGTDPFALQEAGGWNSLAMPRRYVDAAKIANENVKL